MAYEILGKFGIHTVSSLGGFVCEPCGVEISTEEIVFSQHMRTVHGCKKWKDVYALVKDIAADFPVHHPLRDLYRNPTSHCQALPPIPGISFLRARRCISEECNELLATIKSLREHLRKKHGRASVPKRLLQKVPEVDAQTLRKRNRERCLFQVTRPVEKETTVACTSNVNLREALREYEDVLKKGKCTNQDVSGIREQSSFYFLAQPYERLQMHGLRMEDAVELTRGVRDLERLELDFASGKLISDAVKNCFTEAAEAGDRVNIYWSTLSDFCASTVNEGTENKPAFRWLSKDEAGQKTISRYACTVTGLVLMACRVVRSGEGAYPLIPVSTELRIATENLLRLFKRPCVQVEPPTAKVRAVLEAILLQSGTHRDGPRVLFISSYCACICVHATDSTGEEADMRYSQGTEVSRHVSAVIYAASCIAIYRYLTGNLGSAECTRMKSLFMRGAASSISVLSELRSLCVRVRLQEYAHDGYQECVEVDHQHCGFQDGIELSASDVGNTVKLLHAEIKQRVFSGNGLLRGVEIDSFIKKGTEKLCDDESDVNPGYSFETHPSNKEFLHYCREWVLQNVLQHMDAEEMGEWIRRSYLVMDLLLAMIHLVGGAPGRGTELGSLQVRNSIAVRRSVFVNGRNCMLAPVYCKTRSIKGGVVEPLVRYLDENSSNLLKLFLVLIRPWIIIWHTRDLRKMRTELKEQVREGTISREGFDSTCKEIDEDTERVSNLLCLDPKKTTRISTIVGSVMERHGIRMSFGKYRQWQRGLCKRASGERRLLMMANMIADGASAVADEEEAAILMQGAHSVRTGTMLYGLGKSKLGGFEYGLEKYSSILYKKASFLWHEMLGLESPKHSPINYKTPRIMHSETRTQLASNASLRGFRTARMFDFSGAEEIGDGCQRFVGDARHPPNPVEDNGSNHECIEKRAEGLRPFEVPSRLSTEVLDSQRGVNEVLERFPPDVSRRELRLVDALRKVTGIARAEFRCSEQREAMELVWESRQDALIVLGTGSGKTAVVTAPIYLEVQVTVWITMFRALKEETLRRLRDSGIQSALLREYDMQRMPDVRIILATPENVNSDIYESTLLSLYRRDKLRRIVVDEAHVPILSDTYRVHMSRMVYVRPESIRKNVPVVMLSATVPPILVEKTVRALGCSTESTTEIRGNSERSNLEFEIKKISGNDEKLLFANVGAALVRELKRIETIFGGEKERHIVMCLTIGQAEKLYSRYVRGAGSFRSSAIDVEFGIYHSQLVQDEKTRQTQRWMANEKKHFVMFCTEGFGVGIDSPNVRTVTFVGGSRSLIDFWQVAGRGGRDERMAKVIILYNPAVLEACTSGGSEIEEKGLFREWAELGPPSCRVMHIHKYLNGDNSQKRNLCGKCDLCKTRRLGYEGNKNKAQKRPPASISQQCKKKDFRRASLEVYLAKGESAADPSHAPEVYCAVSREKVAFADLDTLRAICFKVHNLCSSCLFFRVARNMKWSMDRAQLQHEKCPRTCARGRCLRCMQVGHDASECKVLNVEKKKTPRCHECFMFSFRGKYIHLPYELGKKKECPFRVMLELALLCWAHPKFHATLLESSQEHGFQGQSVSEFASWLISDHCTKPPGILACALWIEKNFGL